MKTNACQKTGTVGFQPACFRKPTRTRRLEAGAPSGAAWRRNRIGWVGIFLAAFVLAGCDKNDVKVYHVAKEETSVAPVAATEVAAPVHGEMAAATPQLHWTLPPGWTEKTASNMRVASFEATVADGQVADIGVLPMQVAGQELQIVNMWRDQLKLSVTTNVESAAVAIGSGSGKLFSLVSEALLVDGKSRAQILVATLARGEMTWFFKITGADAAVSAQKENFLAFLKSVSFDAAMPAPVATTPAAEAPTGNSIWEVPSGWQVADAMPPLFAKFSIAANGAKADVNISQLLRDGGGMLANVTRWRGQLGLSPLDEAGLAKIISASGSASVVDFSGVNAKTGQPARLVGAAVPHGGQTWFYKLMGDDAVVAAQKDAFLKFIQSAKYPDAR